MACSEAVLKLAETIVIDANESQLRAAMRPHQLGCGVPDRTVLLVTATRAWASEVQRRAKVEIDHPAEDGMKALEQSVMGIDMENACGRVLRSSCIEATLELAPGLAALTGSQWQRPVQAWMKTEDRWVQRPTERGGWQGARLMQVLYSLTLEWRKGHGAREWGLDAGHLPTGAKWAAPGATGRMGYQDDQYLFGRAADLARALPQLDACLAQDGHRVRRDKCSIWNPAMDLPELADQTNAGDTRQALAELALEMTVHRRYRHAGISRQRRTQCPCPGLGHWTAGNAEACGQGSPVGGQSDSFQQRIMMPETSAYGLDIAGQGGDGGPHLRCTLGAAGHAGDHVEGG